MWVKITSWSLDWDGRPGKDTGINFSNLSHVVRINTSEKDTGIIFSNLSHVVRINDLENDTGIIFSNLFHVVRINNLEQGYRDNLLELVSRCSYK